MLEGQLLWIKIYSHILDTHTNMDTHLVHFDNHKTGVARTGPLICIAEPEGMICAGFLKLKFYTNTVIIGTQRMNNMHKSQDFSKASGIY